MQRILTVHAHDGDDDNIAFAADEDRLLISVSEHGGEQLLLGLPQDAMASLILKATEVMNYGRVSTRKPPQ